VPEPRDDPLARALVAVDVAHHEHPDRRGLIADPVGDERAVVDGLPDEHARRVRAPGGSRPGRPGVCGRSAADTHDTAATREEADGMNLGLTALRGTVGALFIGHGTQKLFGWFDGPGLDATAGGFEKMGLRPPRQHATAAGLAEAGGGLLVALGAFTPVAASMITGVMTTAIRKVHAPNGPWVTSGGWEYNAMIIAAMAALADVGPGRPSVDAALFPRFKGPVLAALAVGTGIAGSYLVTERLNETQSAAAPEMGAGDPASPNGAAERETAGASA
jgi:putative oxidoreductase